MFQNRNWSTKGERNPVRVPQLGGRRGRSKPRDQQLALSTILPRAWAMLLQFQKKSEPFRQEMEELTGSTFSFVNIWKWMHICKLGSVEQYSLFKHLVMYSFNEHWMPIKQQMLFLRPCVCVCVCVCVFGWGQCQRWERYGFCSRKLMTSLERWMDTQLYKKGLELSEDRELWVQRRDGSCRSGVGDWRGPFSLLFTFLISESLNRPHA